MDRWMIMISAVTLTAISIPICLLVSPGLSQMSSSPPWKNVREQDASVSLTPDEIRTANDLVTSREARAPYLPPHPGRGMAELDPISLRQPQARAEDLLVCVMLKLHAVKGHLLPEDKVAESTRQTLANNYPGGPPPGVYEAVCGFWKAYAATVQSPAALGRPDHVQRNFVVYLLFKQVSLNQAQRPTRGAGARQQDSAQPTDSLMPADVRLANLLMTSREARAPHLAITVNGRTMPGYDTINLYQDRAAAEDLYVMILLKSRLASGKLPPPPAVERGAREVLNRAYGQVSPWKLGAIRSFWGGYSTTRFSADEIEAPSHLAVWFVYYLLEKSTCRQKAANAMLGATVGSMEAWNRAMQGWQRFESHVNEGAEHARTTRDAYLVEWDADWAVRRSMEAVTGGQ